MSIVSSVISVVVFAEVVVAEVVVSVVIMRVNFGFIVRAEDVVIVVKGAVVTSSVEVFS